MSYPGNHDHEVAASAEWRLRMTDRLEEQAHNWCLSMRLSTKHNAAELATLLRSVAAEARREEAEACAKIAEGMRMKGPSVIGPLHGAGWDGAAGHIANAIRGAKR